MLSLIQNAISIALSVLPALGGQAGVDVGKIAPIIDKVTATLAAVNGLSSPTTISEAIADLHDVLTAAQSSGLLPNAALIDDAIAVIGKFQTVAADYSAGQVAIIDANFHFNGVAGDLIAISKGGAAAQSLGL